MAIITGAASGIGEALARRYLDEGAKVVVVDVKDEGELARRFERTASRVLALRADVTRREDIRRIVDAAVEQFGSVDILFNNAALFDMRPILDESWDVYDRLYAVNVKGMFFLMQAVAKRMVEQGRGGKIINMSSQAGRRGEALVAHYCASEGRRHQLRAIGGARAREGAHQRERHRAGRRRYADVEQVDALFAKYENRPLGEKKRLVGESAARTHGRARRPDRRGAFPRIGGFGLHHRADAQRRRRQLDELKRATGRVSCSRPNAALPTVAPGRRLLLERRGFEPHSTTHVARAHRHLHGHANSSRNGAMRITQAHQPAIKIASTARAPRANERRRRNNMKRAQPNVRTLQARATAGRMLALAAFAAALLAPVRGGTLRPP